MILEDADTCHNQWYHGHGTWCTSDHENRAQKDHTYKDKCIEECMWDPTDKDWLGLCVRSVLLVLRICSWIKHNQKCMKYFEFILYVTPVFWNRSIEDLKGSKVTFLGKTLCQDVVIEHHNVACQMHECVSLWVPLYDKILVTTWKPPAYKTIFYGPWTLFKGSLVFAHPQPPSHLFHPQINPSLHLVLLKLWGVLWNCRRRRRCSWVLI